MSNQQLRGGGWSFSVRAGIPTDPEEVKHGTAVGKQNAFLCLLSGAHITYDYIRAEGKAGRMGSRLMAIVAEGERERVYLTSILEHESISDQSIQKWKPKVPLAEGGLGVRVPNYGLTTFGDLFTSRQLAVLTAFSDLVAEAAERVKHDAIAAGLLNDRERLRNEGTGATAYAEAVSLYLAFVVDKCSDYWSSICTWNASAGQMRSTFGRPAIPMAWDYAEANPFSGSSGNWTAMLEWTRKAVQSLPTATHGSALLQDAQVQTTSAEKLVSTDPPYYDNIGYADLSDFFYLWLRRSVRSVFPDLFTTVVVPKSEELVATPYRHGNKERAEEFFLGGMTRAMRCLAEQSHPALPVTIYYAFKQSEKKGNTGIVSTGWEAFLKAVIHAGFTITGTWPVRTERVNRMRGHKSNALASSVVLVCRRNSSDAPVTTRHEFINILKTEMPKAVMHMQRANIAPVDLAQASIGPGMAIYTRYSRVLDAKGEPVSVRDALILINRTLDEILSEREGDFDADTRWALEWFKQQGFTEGEYGVAETLSKAKNTSVNGLVEAGILSSKSGKVRLLKPSELSENWEPATDKRLTVWEMVHHLVRVLESSGEKAASQFVVKLGTRAEVARELCYQLYTICENQKRANESLYYNSLVQSWPEIARLAQESGTLEVVQTSLFGGEESSM